MSKFDEVRARTADRKARGASQRYPEHAGRVRAGAVRVTLPVLRPECPYQKELQSECSTCAGPNEARRTYYCDHPDNAEGRCTRGNPLSGLWTCATCDRHPDAPKKEPVPVRSGDLPCGVAIGSYKWPALVELQVRAVRATCGPVPVLVSNDHPESAPALAAICAAHPDVTLDTNPERIGHTGGDLAVFWKGVTWGAARGLSVVAKLSQRMIFTGPYWLQDGARDLRASGLGTSGRASTEPRWPFRTEAVLLDVARWNRPEVLEHVAPGRYWDRREGGFAAEVAVLELIRFHLGGAYWPWPALPTNRRSKGPFVWHHSHSADEYRALAARFGVALPGDFHVGGWEGEYRDGIYSYG
ncbi:unnamed protein product [Gemmata massiliana]|uniref:Uncharacterized protein n=1 Tax=Gemmata massiliana TaxID=1210884 RepID=A0A6P2DI61_9BACT|nr:hypothetical protein [Gemmata massiliana]VTS01527.1 unnamed protein product [Gemmata massiliana]